MRVWRLRFCSLGVKRERRGSFDEGSRGLGVSFGEGRGVGV